MQNRTWISIVVGAIVLCFSFGFFLLGLGLFLASSGSSFFDKGDVAVLSVEGEIFQVDPLVQQISKLAKDDAIKAVVLRVNSPGGTIGGSQEVYQELTKLRGKKPVVTSMGTVAASGGYYIACGTTKILANPGTITGSIGVRFEYVNAEDLARWFKLKPKTFKSGRYKDMASPWREMSEEERQILQGTMDALHDQFKHTVAQERSLDIDEVTKLADGRVFTGEEALDLKLIDQLGTLEDAIQEAATLAGIKGEPEVVYPEKKDLGLIELLIENIMEQIIIKLKTSSYVFLG